MKRDRMRTLAWLVVVMGAAVGVLTIALVNAQNATQDALARAIAQAYGSYREPHHASYGAGLLVGAAIAGFGLLLLAIRRPAPRAGPRVSMRGRLRALRAKAREVISGPPEAPLPKAKPTYTPPPWEKKP